MSFLNWFAVSFGLSLLTPYAIAQQTPPACTTKEAPYRDFDFWLGTWDVFQTDGTKAGLNIISKEASGCNLLEQWTSVGGNTGKSFNFVDPNTGKWRQIWISSSAYIDYSGGLEDVTMKLEGTITYNAGGRQAPFRGQWAPNEDGSITQSFWEKSTTTGEWTPWFTGIYRKRSIASDTPTKSPE